MYTVSITIDCGFEFVVGKLSLYTVESMIVHLGDTSSSVFVVKMFVQFIINILK